MAQNFFCTRDKEFKFIYFPATPMQLFDLVLDLYEMQNLIDDPAYAHQMEHLTDIMNTRRNLERFDIKVKELQARRLVVYACLLRRYNYPWNYQPLELAYKCYLCKQTDLTVLEETK